MPDDAPVIRMAPVAVFADVFMAELLSFPTYVWLIAETAVMRFSTSASMAAASGIRGVCQVNKSPSTMAWGNNLAVV
jgi:hypothetical protein